MAFEHKPESMSIEEYLTLDQSDITHKYEYVDGYVYMMAGGSLDHSAICLNLCALLQNMLRGSRCRSYNSDIKVRVSQQRYYHPDAVVTCDPADRGRKDTVQSPCLVFEVLSPSTELVDRTRKLHDYLAYPGLQEYVLVSSNCMKVELYRKEADGRWVYEVYGADDTLTLSCAGRGMAVRDIYENVDVVEVEASDQGDGKINA